MYANKFKENIIMNSSNMTMVMSIFALVWYVLIVIGNIKMFKKANKSAILAIIPVVNFFVLVDAVTNGKWYKGFWVVVPVANIIFMIKFSIKMAKCYGYGTGFGVLNFFFSGVTHIIMGFSDKPFEVVD